MAAQAGDSAAAAEDYKAAVNFWTKAVHSLGGGGDGGQRPADGVAACHSLSTLIGSSTSLDLFGISWLKGEGTSSLTVSACCRELGQPDWVAAGEELEGEPTVGRRRSAACRCSNGFQHAQDCVASCL